MGLDNGFVSLKTGRPGQYQLALDYRNLTRFENSDAATRLWHDKGLLQPSPNLRYLDLELERQQAGIGLSYDFGAWHHSAT